MMANKLQLTKIACPELPDQSRWRQSSTDSGTRRYSEPSQVIVKKKKSIGQQSSEVDCPVSPRSVSLLEAFQI
jgi:hypothetical protein